MSNIAKITSQIRFNLEKLGTQNAHHEFEHLCRHLASMRICTNILPATGPVSAGGDQGRDFETYKSYIDDDKENIVKFRSEIKKEKIVFCCTIQKKNIIKKIKSDIVNVMSDKQITNSIYYFCIEEINVSKRHELQKWVDETYKAHLEIIDGQGISLMLSEIDTFWIAEEYLHVPKEIYPNYEELKKVIEFNFVIDELKKTRNDEDKTEDDIYKEYEFKSTSVWQEGIEFFSYKKSKRRVALYGLIPKTLNKELTCMINFCYLRISDCMITLNQDEILNTLFTGIKTKYNLMIRKFILFPSNSNEDKYYVQLGNCRFTLTGEELEEICEFIDDFYERYIELIMEKEKKVGAIQFKYSKKFKGFKLLTIEKELWDKLLDFSWRYDWANGKSKWHIFNKNNIQIQVTIDRGNSINVELVPSTRNNYVDIYWKQNFGYHYPIDLNSFNENQRWKVDYTYQWIINQFIPYVLYEEYKDSHLINIYMSFEKFKCKKLNWKGSVDFLLPQEIYQIEDKKSLTQYINIILNVLYREEEKLYFDAKISNSLYNFAIGLVVHFCDDNMTEAFNIFDLSINNYKELSNRIANLVIPTENILETYKLKQLLEYLLNILYSGKNDISVSDYKKLQDDIRIFDDYIKRILMKKKYL